MPTTTTKMAADDSRRLEELRKKLEGVALLPEEPNFHLDKTTLQRYLVARERDVSAAAQQLKSTVAWRKDMKPWQQWCQYCIDQPGFHSLRQIGFDLMGRPVIYSCFAQAAARSNTAADCVDHVVYLLESAMAMGASSWVFIIDCSGMNTNCCNPKLGKGVTKVLADHYPETLGLVICVNHNVVFQGVYKAVRVFLDSNTAAKVVMVTDKKKRTEIFKKHFSADMVDWLLQEIKLNKQHPLPDSQAQFWLPPEVADAHDPRGCPDYVREHILPLGESAQPGPSTADGAASRLWRPHPNILHHHAMSGGSNKH